jgi:hypothetical protein
MYFRKIPLSIQFEAAYAAVTVHERRNVWKILRGYGYPFWIISHDKHLKKYLSFTLSQLLEYFRQHPDLCEKIIVDCGDKRWSPDTYIEGEGRRFSVGYFDTKTVPNRSEVQFFDNIEEAVTDYVLLSLKMPRLK